MICANDYSKIGVYSSEEKAMKVLRMIKEKIIEIDKNKLLGMTEATYVDCVFEMPQYDEV